MKYSNISTEDKARELKAAIDLLTKAGIITPIYHSSCSGIPLDVQADFLKFKLLFLDIGLMNRVCGLDWLALNSMDERKLVNEGSIAEQFIGQHLLYLNNVQEAPNLAKPESKCTDLGKMEYWNNGMMRYDYAG